MVSQETIVRVILNEIRVLAHGDGAARGIRTPDPIITNDVNSIPFGILWRTFIFR
jgi:hypothetical protein